MGVENFNAPVGMLKRQPSQLEGDLPFEPVTMTFRCSTNSTRDHVESYPVVVVKALKRHNKICMLLYRRGVLSTPRGRFACIRIRRFFRSVLITCT